MRRVLGAAGGVGIGVMVALACAGSAEQTADGAGPGTPDGGVLSSFVSRAQRGEVAPPDLDEVEHMCALLISCDRLPIPPGLVPSDFQACVKHFTEEMTSATAIQFSLTLRECGLQANSCQGLRACALHGADPAACNGRGKTDRAGVCDVDGRAITCVHEQMVAVRDCGRGGEQCVIAGGEAKCTLGPCPANIKDGDKPICSQSGTHKLQCEKGKLVSLDCAAFGLKCTTGSDGTAACATAGAACAGDGQALRRDHGGLLFQRPRGACGLQRGGAGVQLVARLLAGRRVRAARSAGRRLRSNREAAVRRGEREVLLQRQAEVVLLQSGRVQSLRLQDRALRALSAGGCVRLVRRVLAALLAVGLSACGSCAKDSAGTDAGGAAPAVVEGPCPRRTGCSPRPGCARQTRRGRRCSSRSAGSPRCCPPWPGTRSVRWPGSTRASATWSTARAHGSWWSAPVHRATRPGPQRCP